MTTASASLAASGHNLANLGTAACINLLSPQDKVAVIAVDSSPHLIQGMRNVDDRDEIISRVLRIQSMGGGIFVYEALVAAGNELMKAGEYSTRRKRQYPQSAVAMRGVCSSSVSATHNEAFTARSASNTASSIVMAASAG